MGRLASRFTRRRGVLPGVAFCVSYLVVAQLIAPISADGRAAHLFLRVDPKGLQGEFQIEVPTTAPTAQPAPGAAKNQPAVHVEWSLDSQPLTPVAGAAGSLGAGGSGFSFDVPFAAPLAKGAHRLVVKGLEPLTNDPLAVTMIARDGIAFSFVSPWNVSERSSTPIPNGERLLLRYDRFAGGVFTLGLESDVAESSGWIGLFAQDAIKYATPILTAMTILLCSTWIQRWLSTRATQVSELTALNVRLKRIKAGNDLDRRQEFIEYIRTLQTRSEYAGFGEKFTKPLEAILEQGNAGDLADYRTNLEAAKPDAKLAWVFFFNPVT